MQNRAVIEYPGMVFLLYSLLPFLCPVLGLYSSNDDVIELTPSNFNRVTSDDSVWFVEFYAPWCGHCKNLAPEWKKAATALKGVVKLAAVNADEHSSLASTYNVKGFPTILMFVKDKHKTSTPYTGGRQASHIVKEALEQVKKLVESRIGQESSSGGGSGRTDVVELTDNNFEDVVLKSEEPWLVEFFAPWCGHCKNLKPHWETAATELKGVMKVGAVDATVHNQLSQKYGIRGFPTIKFFPAGSKKNADPVDYDGGRTSDDIVRWAMDKAEALMPDPELIEITSSAVFLDTCEKHQICVISVLPSLYDCQSDCRNQHLNTIKQQASEYKKQKWGWAWTEALKQPELEKMFDIGGAGYPAMVAVHSKKLKRATLRGSFSTEGIHDFLRSLLHGDPSMQLFPVRELPKILTVDPWDGKDAPPIEDEEIDWEEMGIKRDL
ncbi:Protein disulfide-isomerase A6 [Clonorchis sinensis]|uniref:protein disulfide-isomerase n=1 Tax=Clonorchis sinensis TaxID=79923 RepID=A0A8T1MZX7_CLOSI|nr:Protein disulfide-isomerase A6 [Clonorchis sinensis]